MGDQHIDNSNLEPEYWKKKSLEELLPHEWEALCDGCGKCCLNKLEDYESGEIELTNLACHLLDCRSCQCSDYENRFEIVPECILLTPKNVNEIKWLPKTCAYALIRDNKPLPSWHHLISGSKQTVHSTQNSVKTYAISEINIEIDEYENYIIDEENL